MLADFSLIPATFAYFLFNKITVNWAINTITFILGTSLLHYQRLRSSQIAPPE